MSTSSLDWTVQRIVSPAGVTLPEDADFARWIAAAAEHAPLSGELTLRLVGNDESRQLNATYRGKDKPTNVLSFDYDTPGIAGDLVFCVDVIDAEAGEQGKSPTDHWAHMTIHGLLHLAGFDHVVSHDAAIMEAREIAILAELDISNPYDEPAATGHAA